MIDFLFIALGVVALRSCRIAAITFALFAIAHDQLFSGTSADVYWIYYLYAGIFAVAAMGAMSVLAKPCKTTTGLIYVCAASFLINAYGCLLWFNSKSTSSYDICSLMLYCVAILIMLRKDRASDECSRDYNIVPAVRRKSLAFSFALSKENKS